jgi:FkbM family methyltransferase
MYRRLIQLGIRNDYWVQISDTKFFEKKFGMHSCQFSDQIACNVLKFGWQAYEPPMGLLISTFAKYLPLTFIDIGANTGFYSLLASASGAKKVFSYEPVPGIFSILKSNVISSKLCINLYQEAIADQPGQMPIYLPKNNSKYIETSASLNPDFRSQHAEKVVIQVRTLDELAVQFKDDALAQQDIFLVKIDVESYELPVLIGGGEFFKNIRPLIIIELLDTNKDRQEIYDVISAYGYKAFALGFNSVEKLSFLSTSSASNNYLFVPNEKINTVSETLSNRAGMKVLT